MCKATKMIDSDKSSTVLHYTTTLRVLVDSIPSMHYSRYSIVFSRKRNRRRWRKKCKVSLPSLAQPAPLTQAASSAHFAAWLRQPAFSCMAAWLCL